MQSAEAHQLHSRGESRNFGKWCLFPRHVQKMHLPFAQLQLQPTEWIEEIRNSPTRSCAFRPEVQIYFVHPVSAVHDGSERLRSCEGAVTLATNCALKAAQMCEEIWMRRQIKTGCHSVLMAKSFSKLSSFVRDIIW